MMRVLTETQKTLKFLENTQDLRELQSFCMLCPEDGKPREVWYCCRLCGGWAHKECTGCVDPSRYHCDILVYVGV